MKEILVTGSSGLVGSRFVSLHQPKGELLTPSHQDLDISSKEAVLRYIKKHEPNVIINFAAYTNVDGAEVKEEKGQRSGQAWKINVEGARNLAEVAKKHGTFLIHISTDFVFPGTSKFPGPYNESDNPNEGDSDLIGWYAKTKLSAERALLIVGGDLAIVRISFPFGNPNSEKDLTAKTRKVIELGYGIYSNQKITPTYIPDLVNAVAIVMERKLTGIYHVATNPVTTPYEFGRYFAKKSGIPGEIKEGSMPDFVKDSGKAPRPLIGGLNTKHTAKLLGIKFMTWQEAIDEFVGLLATNS